ncbi:hypothetical protein G3O00_29215 [Burkholderia sp. Ac-20384]|uniref:hypothetical protein n=1 Tax=Burkholderia TaxID=32008 RepID=UPI0015827677|nr:MULTISPECIES: hypothetical protein [Burkholderia]MBN3827674.1 hypothetical protein [Burkholderia sp. Ac-20384]
MIDERNIVDAMTLASPFSRDTRTPSHGGAAHMGLPESSMIAVGKAPDAGGATILSTCIVSGEMK